MLTDKETIKELGTKAQIKKMKQKTNNQFLVDKEKLKTKWKEQWLIRKESKVWWEKMADEFYDLGKSSQKEIDDKEFLEFLKILRKGNWNIPMEKSLLIEEKIEELEEKK